MPKALREGLSSNLRSRRVVLHLERLGEPTTEGLCIVRRVRLCYLAVPLSSSTRFVLPGRNGVLAATSHISPHNLTSVCGGVTYVSTPYSLPHCAGWGGGHCGRRRTRTHQCDQHFGHRKHLRSLRQPMLQYCTFVAVPLHMVARMLYLSVSSHTSPTMSCEIGGWCLHDFSDCSIRC